MASKVLKETKNISLLEGLLGKDLTRSFKEFCTCNTVTLEDVLNHNYNALTFAMDANKKYVTALTLSKVDMDNFEEVYDFIMKVGPEPCAVFESIWVGTDQDREEKLMEVKMKYREEREKQVRSILIDEEAARKAVEDALNEADQAKQQKRI